MRIRNRKKVPYKAMMVAFFTLLPFLYVGYFAIQISLIYNDMVQFSFDSPPDPSTFEPVNYTMLAEMADFYDFQYENFHIPLNFTTAAVFTNTNYTAVKYWDYGDNGALWTGTAMAGWVFKYVAAVREGNASMQADALRVVKKLIHGMSMMVIVPNGGLGSEYGGILARGWAPPENQSIAQYYFNQDDRHFNGTGVYSQYRWRGYTSNDEYGGFYMALALALKYIPDLWVQWTIGQVVDQVANYMLHTNFLGIHGTGAPTGVDQKPKFGGGAYWTAVLLKMGAICMPEKYERIYYHYMTDNFEYMSAKEGGSQETISNYYAYNFGHDVVFAFLLLEGKNTQIGQKFYQGYLEGLRKVTEYHRNAYFNAIYLALISQPGEYMIIEKDIEDQLMRMKINHFPDRVYGIRPLPSSYQKVESFEKWKKFFQENPYGSLYRIAFPEINIGDDDIYYTRPLTVEYMNTGDFIWGDNPYKYQDNETNVLKEESGMTFTVPYWICRANGFIKPSGFR